MNDIIDISSIRQLVDSFYATVGEDELLGPVFKDIIKDDWQPHLDKMYDFWNAALFGVPGFRGNPFAKHAPLGIGTAHFARWLELFGKTVDSQFEGTVADDAKKRAGLMAAMFKERLQLSTDKNKIIF